MVTSSDDLRRTDVPTLVGHGDADRVVAVCTTAGPHCHAAVEDSDGPVGVVDDRALAQEAAEDRARLEGCRRKAELLVALAHDLRNPLAAVRGTAQVLSRRLERDQTVDRERLASALAAIDVATGQMTGLLDQLLDFARLRMDGPLDRDHRPTELVGLARQAAETQQAGTERHQVRFETDVSNLVGLWGTERLERMVQNLLANAIKYSPAGGAVMVRVWREMRDGRLWAALSVSDQGLGIPAGDLPHVFEQFHRASNVIGQIAGTGIGLAVALQIAEQHGGSLAVESQEGHGSTFTLHLPLGPNEGGNQ